MFIFDRFQTGEHYGIHRYHLTTGAVQGWCRLFPEDDTGDLMPLGMTAVVTIRAYTVLITPRPAGNIHGAQRFEMRRLPKIGETLSTGIRCVGKELRRGRRWVYLDFETRGGNDDVAFLGHFSSMVAA